MSYKLYCFAESGHSYKIALALQLAGAKWDPIFVDFFAGETRSAEYLAEVNEMGEAPVFVDGDVKLTQSGVILDYFNGRVGSYWGETEAQRREILRWMFWDTHKFSSNLGTARFLMNFFPKEKRPQEAIANLNARNRAALKTLETHLEGRDWVATDRASAADICCSGYLFYPEDFGFERSAYPNIDRWLTNLQSLPNWAHPYDMMQRAFPTAPKE